MFLGLGALQSILDKLYLVETMLLCLRAPIVIPNPKSIISSAPVLLKVLQLGILVEARQITN